MKTATYKEWQAQGYHVIKGRKAVGRNGDGVCVFSEHDVAFDARNDMITQWNMICKNSMGDRA